MTALSFIYPLPGIPWYTVPVPAAGCLVLTLSRAEPWNHLEQIISYKFNVLSSSMIRTPEHPRQHRLRLEFKSFWVFTVFQYNWYTSNIWAISMVAVNILLCQQSLFDSYFCLCRHHCLIKLCSDWAAVITWSNKPAGKHCSSSMKRLFIFKNYMLEMDCN